MVARRPHINRVLRRAVTAAVDVSAQVPIDATRKLRRMVIDFSALHLPPALSLALAEAFWNQVDVRADQTVRTYWHHLRIFGRFVAQTHALKGISDVRRELLVRYIEWLNTQRGGDGKPWSKGTRYSTYTTLRTLLLWLMQCRPGLLGEIEFPINPYPWKNRDVERVEKLPAKDLRAILKACEHDITDLRALRREADQALVDACSGGNGSTNPVGKLLQLIDQHHGGILPPSRVLCTRGYCPVQLALKACGGAKRIEPSFYPRSASLLPYYLAILIHTAGNPDAIAALDIDCLQAIPLLDDRELLVWSKSRAGALQRRSFRNTDSFEPPMLVRELVQWTRRLRPHAAVTDRNRLFLYKGTHGASALSPPMIKQLHASFMARHRLPYFTFACLRPSVLSAFYRAYGDLRQVKAIANHAHLSTTVGYVEGSEIEGQNRVRVATLQSAFLGHIEHPLLNKRRSKAIKRVSPSAADSTRLQGTVVSMFGFNCKDAFAGIAPGTRVGELCTHFLGCFTCPNAIITADAASLARLLQARDHLQAASGYLHPARWEAIYAPQLRILVEDILTRFSARDLAAAAPLRATLPLLPELR
jgi:hypothetical protein